MIIHVSFIKYYNYDMEVPDDSLDTEERAIAELEEEFENDMRCPIADTTYDEIDVWYQED